MLYNIYYIINIYTIVSAAFGPVFDEIVVESSLTVRRKNDATGRQAKSNQNITSNSDGTQSNKKLIKRQLHM